MCVCVCVCIAGPIHTVNHASFAQQLCKVTPVILHGSVSPAPFILHGVVSLDNSAYPHDEPPGFRPPAHLRVP